MALLLFGQGDSSHICTPGGVGGGGGGGDHGGYGDGGGDTHMRVKWRPGVL